MPPAITLTLPHILEPGERLMNRPSLAAGNSPAQQYDVESDRRISEFKLAAWSGTEAMRKRGVFHDFVHLAADTSGRWPELYVVGPAPIRFLAGTRSTPGGHSTAAPTAPASCTSPGSVTSTSPCVSLPLARQRASGSSISLMSFRPSARR